MRVCKKCGFENADGMKFCGKCGNSLTVGKRKTVKCPACGASVDAEMNFCGKCGATMHVEEEKVEILSENTATAVHNDQETEQQPQEVETDRGISTARTSGIEVCANCGAMFDPPDAGFCAVCGAPKGKCVCKTCGTVNDASVVFCSSCGNNVKDVDNNRSSRPVPDGSAAKKRSYDSVRKKILDFENRRHLIVNLVALCVCVVMFFVSLFAPIKLTSALTDDNGNSVDKNTIEYSQSIWQVFSAMGALSLDPGSESDVREIRSIINDYSKHLDEVNKTMSGYVLLKGERWNEKYRQVYADIMSDVNILEYQIAISMPGTYEALNESDGEKLTSNEAALLDSVYGASITTLIFAFICALIQLGIAVLSLVFLIFAVIGLIRKRTVKIYPLFLTLMILAGVGLTLAMAAPLLSAGGALFAVFILTSVAFLLSGLFGAIVNGKHVGFIVKKSVLAGVNFIIVLLLCTNVLSLTMETYAGSYSSMTANVPLGSTLEQVITCATYNLYSKATIVFSDMTIPVGITALALGITTFGVMYFATVKSLSRLYRKTEHKARLSIETLVGIVLAVLFAIIPAVMSVTDTVTEQEGISVIRSLLSVRAQVYVAIVFAVGAFVFGLVFNPDRKKNKPQIAVQPSADTTVSA